MTAAKTAADSPPPPPARGAPAPSAPAPPRAVPIAPSSAQVAPAGVAAAESAMARLLKTEAALRQVRSFQELTYFIANELRGIARAQQIWVASAAARGQLRIEAVTSQAFVDRASPLVVEFEQMLGALSSKQELGALRESDLAVHGGGRGSLAGAYPLPNLLWAPILALDGRLIGGMLLARAVPWTDQDITIVRHLAGACAFAWLAVAKPRRAASAAGLLRTRKGMVLAALAIAGVSVFPVSMSALAPVEVAPRGSFVVTAGVDGVVQAVDVEPNAPVAKGQPLVRLTDTVLKNRHAVAEREVVVAEAQQKKAAQLAFVDLRGRHELALAQSELDLKIAERNYAREMLDRATIVADRDGVAFFADKKDLIGRPVAVGEKLMEIVQPTALEFHIDLPVADAIVLRDGARVKVFLDSDPLRPLEATLVRKAYKARLADNQQLAFRLVAEASPGSRAALRLGVRGTAQVYSDQTPLLFYLLRRPLAAARQMLGV